MDKRQIMLSIMQMLNITESRYNELMFEYGISYFEFKCDGFPSIRQAFTESKGMWNWWKNQYMMVDEGIVNAGGYLSEDLYRAIHLGIDYHPDPVILKKAMQDYDKAAQREIRAAKSI